MTACPHRNGLAALLLVLTVIAAGCEGGDESVEVGGDAPTSVTLSSPAFDDGGRIPVEFTCDGDDVAPPLTWSDVPEGATFLALTVRDPDAPGGDFVHWLVAGIPADTGGLEVDALPDTAVQGTNGFGQASWGGPCPPEGDDAHRYHFTVFAVDTDPALESGFGVGELEEALEGHVLARGELTGRYRRGGDD